MTHHSIDLTHLPCNSGCIIIQCIYKGIISQSEVEESKCETKILWENRIKWF